MKQMNRVAILLFVLFLTSCVSMSLAPPVIFEIEAPDRAQVNSEILVAVYTEGYPEITGSRMFLDGQEVATADDETVEYWLAIGLEVGVVYEIKVMAEDVTGNITTATHQVVSTDWK